MKEVVELIEEKKQEFAQLPLFQYMQDKSISPLQRLAWAPCVIPFVMEFGQLNKYYFRKEPTLDPLQQIINKHTYEDDHHWIWLLEDLKKLGFDEKIKLSDAIKFFWGDETYNTRQVCHQIALHTFQEEPIVILAAIEAIEATGNVAFVVIVEVANELQKLTKQNYRYFGEYHFRVEQGHASGTDKVEQILANLQLTDAQKNRAFKIVEKIFELFSKAIHEMMAYAINHPVVNQKAIA